MTTLKIIAILFGFCVVYIMTLLLLLVGAPFSKMCREGLHHAGEALNIR